MKTRSTAAPAAPPATIPDPAAKESIQCPAHSPATPGSEDPDTDYLEVREQIIRLALKSSIAAARALYEIHTHKEGALWRKNYPSFEAYCRVRWNYGKSHAYRLRDCGELIHRLESSGTRRFPISEGQIRPLLQLPPENRVDCWRGISADHNPDNLTAKIISDEVGSFAASQCIDIGRRRRSEPSQRVVKVLEQLKKVVSGMKRSEDIGRLINQINDLLKL